MYYFTENYFFYNIVMEKKKMVKAISNDNFDSEDYVSSSEDPNDASSVSNNESEIARQLAHNNNHKFNLIMEHIAALEAENACLQTHLNKETSGKKNQHATIDAKFSKRKLNT